MLNLLIHNCHNNSFSWIEHIILNNLLNWFNPLPLIHNIPHNPFPLLLGFSHRGKGLCCIWKHRIKFFGSAKVTALALSPCQRFLVVGDNHERVRISCYPEARLVDAVDVGGLEIMCAFASVWVCSKSENEESNIIKYEIISNLHPPTGYEVRFPLISFYATNGKKNNQQHQQQDIFCGLPMIDDDYWWQLSITCRKP